MTLLQGPTNQTKHDMISPEILKAGVHLHLLEWHDALVVQQNRKAPWKKKASYATFDFGMKNCSTDNLFSGAKTY